MESVSSNRKKFRISSLDYTGTAQHTTHIVKPQRTQPCRPLSVVLSSVVCACICVMYLCFVHACICVCICVSVCCVCIPVVEFCAVGLEEVDLEAKDTGLTLALLLTCCHHPEPPHRDTHVSFSPPRQQDKTKLWLYAL